MWRVVVVVVVVVVQALQGEIARMSNGVDQLTELAKAQGLEISRLKDMQNRLAKSQVGGCF